MENRKQGCNFIRLGENSTAIICGGKSDHKCNDDNFVFILSDGSQIPDTPANRFKHEDDIRGGSVACSICGRAAIDDAPYF